MQFLIVGITLIGLQIDWDGGSYYSIENVPFRRRRLDEIYRKKKSILIRNKPPSTA